MPALCDWRCSPTDSATRRSHRNSTSRRTQDTRLWTATFSKERAGSDRGRHSCDMEPVAVNTARVSSHGDSSGLSPTTGGKLSARSNGMNITIVGVGEVDQLRPGCFHFISKTLLLLLHRKRRLAEARCFGLSGHGCGAQDRVDWTVNECGAEVWRCSGASRQSVPRRRTPMHQCSCQCG